MSIIERAAAAARRARIAAMGGPVPTGGPQVAAANGAPGTVSNEHYIPGLGLEVEPYLAAGDQMGIHHLARYHWACRVLADAQPGRVLDIACGAGYGSYLLAGALPGAQITGADYDPDAVALARQTFARPNIRHVKGDMVTWTAEVAGPEQPLGTYDAVVSFDTIEHLRHREIGLMQIVRNLTPGGQLLLSTPCGHSVTNLRPAWEHHEIEYSFHDLQDFLRRYFRTVLLPEDGVLPHLAYWADVINRDKVRYLNVTNPVVCRDPIRFN